MCLLLFSQESRQISAESDEMHRGLIICNENSEFPFYQCRDNDQYMHGDKNDQDNKINSGESRFMVFSHRRNIFYLGSRETRSLRAFDGSTNSVLTDKDIAEEGNWAYDISAAMDKEEDNIYVLYQDLYERTCTVRKYNIDSKSVVTEYDLEEVCENNYPKNIAVGSEYLYVGFQSKGIYGKPYLAFSKYKLDGTPVKIFPGSSYSDACSRGVHVDEKNLLWCNRGRSVIRFNEDETAITAQITRNNLPSNLESSTNPKYWENAEAFALDTSTKNVHISAVGLGTSHVMVFSYSGEYVGKTETNPNGGPIGVIVVWPGNNAAYTARQNYVNWSSFTLNLPTNSPTTTFDGEDYDFESFEASFQDDTTGFSIMLAYEVGHSVDLLNTTLYDQNCTNLNSDSIINTAGNSASGSNGSFTKKIVIDKTKFGTSDLVTRTDGSSKGVLAFCIKSEAISDSGVSVSFQKDKLQLSYDLTTNSFSVLSNVIEENDVTTTSKNITTVYGVIANRCNKTSNEYVDPAVPLNQNSLFFICLKPNSSDVSISNFNLDLIQEDFTFPAVTRGDDGWRSTSLSSVSIDEATVRVSTRLVTGLFENGKTQFTASGNAYLTFNSIRRELGSVRHLQYFPEKESTGKSPFEMKVFLQHKEGMHAQDTNSSIISVYFFVGLAICTVFLLFKKMKN